MENVLNHLSATFYPSNNHHCYQVRGQELAGTDLRPSRPLRPMPLYLFRMFAEPLGMFGRSHRFFKGHRKV
ncbi:hypothetical protein LDENG_00220940 [Lucifuga dentata]|nr:hypothetical protein LDENG_00220940 [Lucifuga dentata]